MNRICVILSVFFLSACSSSSVQQVNYYLLSGASSHSMPMVEIGDKEKIYLQDIRLAEYLTQSALPLQLKSHQIFYSRQHAWAETLEKGIEKALLADLNQQSSKRYFIGATEPDFDGVNRKLVVQFDHFVATDQSNVIASGTYWFSKNTEGSNYAQKRFTLTNTLTQDGYPHSVEKLRSLVTQLSKLIEQDMQEPSL